MVISKGAKARITCHSPVFCNKKTEPISCGDRHTAILTKSGEVYTFGYNKYGQLGRKEKAGENEENHKPKQIEFDGGKIAAISCGGNHTAILTKSGEVYTFGSNLYGQLGRKDNVGKEDENPIPKKIEWLGGKIAAISCGDSHTAILTKSGEVYTFGDNEYGQLGRKANTGGLEGAQRRGPDAANPIPTKIEGVPGKIAAISCGYLHSAFLTKNGDVYTFGYNKYGQLGRKDNVGDVDDNGRPTPNPTPTKIELRGGVGKIAAISCGYSHTAFLTKNGEVYTFGYNIYGQLGRKANTGDNPIPTKIEGVPGKIAAISCGGYHTAFLTKNGDVYTFGWNKYGPLGRKANTDENPTPKKVQGLPSI